MASGRSSRGHRCSLRGAGYLPFLPFLSGFAFLSLAMLVSFEQVDAAQARASVGHLWPHAQGAPRHRGGIDAKRHGRKPGTTRLPSCSPGPARQTRRRACPRPSVRLPPEPSGSDVELNRGGRLGQPGRHRERRHDQEPVEPRPGTEKLELDLSKVPTVEQGLADAAERDRGFIGLSKAAFGQGPDRPYVRGAPGLLLVQQSSHVAAPRHRVGRPGREPRTSRSRCCAEAITPDRVEAWLAARQGSG
jgi:hypothetical protein